MTDRREGSFAPIRPDAWSLDPGLAPLNHGSFGACPATVLRRQTELRERMESAPGRFFLHEAQPLLDASRRALAECIGADADDLVFVANTTAAVNAVLRSLRFGPGDELLVTNHGYNACDNVVRYVAERHGATVVVARVPVPIESPQQVVDAVLRSVTDRTRIAVLDHVTSATAAVFPIETLVRELAARGVDTLVDGAHAPGMVPLEVKRIAAAYYVGNCHKWLCAPKGAGFLCARPDRQPGLQSPIISHGYNSPRPGYPRLQDAFDWPGTDDPTAWICVGEAIGFLSGLVEGGLSGLMRRNRELALAARRMLCDRLGLSAVCPEEMIGSMAAMRLPDDPDPAAPMDPTTPTPTHRYGAELFRRFAIDVPVYYWPEPPRLLLRVSAQAYNSFEQYERLAEILAGLLRAGKVGRANHDAGGASAAGQT